MSFKNKILILLIASMSISLAISSIVYYKNIKEIFKDKDKKTVLHDMEYVKKYIINLENNLNKLADNIAKNENLQLSLNLISKYEDKNNYSKEIFDYEKKSLLDKTKQWINIHQNKLLIIYNSNMDLVSLNNNEYKNIITGYISYEDSKAIFIDDKNKNSKDFKSISKIIEESKSGKFKITTNRDIIIDNEKVGAIELSHYINKKDIDNINSNLINQVFFTINSNKTIGLKNSLKELLDSNDDRYSKFNFTILNNLDSTIVINRTITQNKLKNTMIKIIFIWLIIFIGVFIISAIFTSKYIINPILRLKSGIYMLNNRKYSKINEITPYSNDEIGEITKEFNNLSKNLRKNLSFLEAYQKVIDKANIVTKSDLDGNITYVNDKFCQITGYRKDEIIGKPHSLIRHRDVDDKLFEKMWKTIKNGDTWHGTIKNKTKYNREYWEDIVISPIKDENDNIIEYVSIRHDVTEIIEQKSHIEILANSDTLTGLGNRLKLLNDIKNSNKASLSIINIDRFREINDFYGIKLGDTLLQKFAFALSSLLEEQKCNLYRLQSDEFVVLNLSMNREDFIYRISFIIKSLSKYRFKIREETLLVNITASISFEDSSLLLITADMALKTAKKRGEDLLVYSQDISLNREYENNLKWAKKLKSAIKNDRIVPYLQPIVNNKSKKYDKYEALVRLVDVNGKVVSPFFFLDIAKKTKQYSELSKIMIQKTFDIFKDRDEEFSINLTVDDILNKDLQKYIIYILKKYDISERVVFEIVESESIENFSEVCSFIEIIKSFGSKIAIDDFGTGYSNFEYLMKLNADYIKIDGSMIKNIDKDENSRVVVETIVNFAKKMNMKTIAEFVENESIFNIVNELGIDYSQGYYFSPPVKEIE